MGVPLPEEGRLFGSCVNITVRICDAATAESIYVSDALYVLAARLACPLVDRGLHALKGIETPLRLYELEWR